MPCLWVDRPAGWCAVRDFVAGVPRQSWFVCSAPLSLVPVPDKSEREAARESVATYHEEQLSVLVQHVADGVDRFRSGAIDAFEADLLIFQYSRAAKELWKFCNGTDLYVTAGMVRDSGSIDWWGRGAPRRR